MIRNGVQGVEFICANTDAQALTRSLAQAADPARRDRAGRRRQARGRPGGRARGSASAIREALGGAHMVFITAGMGGGTGTGAAPVIAEWRARWAS